MKKVLSLILLLTIMSSCSSAPQGGDVAESEEVKETLPRTVVLNEPYSQISDGTRNFKSEFDFDGDGNKERVHIDLIDTEDRSSSYMLISIGDRTLRFSENDCYGIGTVYACDIDVNDGVYDLAVIIGKYNSSSYNSELTIFKYDENLTPYNLGEGYSGKSIQLGRNSADYFKVNDDGTFTLRRRENPDASDVSESQEEYTDNGDILSTYRMDEGGTVEKISDKTMEEAIKENVNNDSVMLTRFGSRTVMLNRPYSHSFMHGDGFQSEFDFDSDGNKEQIYIDIIDTGWSSGKSEEFPYMLVNIGDRVVKTQIEEDGLIMMVYACDIDVNDGVYDLAVITEELSADTRIRIFRYDENLTPYSFGERDYNNSMWIGYVYRCYFNVNDDNTITLRCGSGAGMWDKMETYTLNENGEFEEIKPEKGYYEILADHVNTGGWGDDYDPMTEEERLKLRDGYIMAHCKCSNEQITLNKGDYFKVLYEDFNGNIYIEKETGEGGWIKLDISDNLRYELNSYFFYMAG